MGCSKCGNILENEKYSEPEQIKPQLNNKNDVKIKMSVEEEINKIMNDYNKKMINLKNKKKNKNLNKEKINKNEKNNNIKNNDKKNDENKSEKNNKEESIQEENYDEEEFN